MTLVFSDITLKIDWAKRNEADDTYANPASRLDG